jgi:preprotein translocase subunit SecD
MVTCQRESEEKFILAPVAVEGARINGAEAAIDPTNALAGWVVNLRFDGEGTTQFGTTTADLVDNPSPTNAFAIVLDGVVVSAPVVQSAILDGNAQITGDFTQQEATDLANVLKYGALPLAFETGEIQTISPTLGNDQLRAGIYAGLLGLFLVAVYSLLYYRGLGLVSVFSLLLAALLTFGLLVLLGETIGYTLTLAGIAGAIVAIGITADSFIVYFERVRDEMRDGRSFRVAVETGWARARRTILAADAVSMIAAVVLYILSVGGVRGFAFTLGLTTIIDVAVVFLFTKPLMTVLARTRFYGEGMRFSGVEARRLHAQPVPSAASTRGRRPAGSPKEA